MGDSTDAAAATLPPESSPLRRRNSIATSVVVATNLAFFPATPPHRTTSVIAPPTQNPNTQTPPSSLLNLELVSFKPPFSNSYTSLRDLLPYTSAVVNSPTASSTTIISSGHEISIRNRLVKQAAWAYLQPMSASANGSSAPDFFRRIWMRFSSGSRRNPVTAFLSFINHQLVPGFARILRRILNAIRGQVRT